MKSFCKIIIHLLFTSFLLMGFIATANMSPVDHSLPAFCQNRQNTNGCLQSCITNNSQHVICIATVNTHCKEPDPIEVTIGQVCNNIGIKGHSACEGLQKLGKCTCLDNDIQREIDHNERCTSTGVSYTDEEGRETVIARESFPKAVTLAINKCESGQSKQSDAYCNCLIQKADAAPIHTAHSWLDFCSSLSGVVQPDMHANVEEIDTPAPDIPDTEPPVADADTPPTAADTPTETADADTPPTAASQRDVASPPVNIGNLGSCDSPTLNNHCSTPSQDSPTVIPDSETLQNEIESAKDDAAPKDIAGADPYEKAQFDCRDSLDHDKSGAEYVCNNPVKALGGPAAQAIRAIGQYGSIGAGVIAATGKESLNKLCTTIAMLSATGVGIGVAARRKCSGKIKKCQKICEQEKTQICTAYQTERAKCLTVQAKLRGLQAAAFTSPAAAPFAERQKEVLNIYQTRIKEYQNKVVDIESVKRQCKKQEANIAGMGQDILNMVMTLGTAKACRDATGGKYTSDIDNCEERGGEIIPDPLGNMICKEPDQKCSTTSECPENEMCMNGICQAITGMCSDGSLKACSETCENGEPPANCPKTGTCSDGSTQPCSENCENGTKPQGCENNEDNTTPPDPTNDETTCPDPSLTYPHCNCECPTGQLCNPDNRQCIPPTTDDDDDNTCPDPSLTYPDCDCNCPEGQTCDSQRKCVKGSDDGKGDCSDGSRVACDQNCTDGSQPTGCRSCNGDSECGENQICNRGVCVPEDPVLEEQDGSGGGGSPISDMGDELAITNDGMGGGDGNPRNPARDPLSGLGELPDAAQLGGSQGAGAGGGSSAGGGSGGGGFFSRLFGGRKGKSKGKGAPMSGESGATVKGAGGGGFGGYGGGGRKKGGGKLALNKKQLKKLKKEKGAKRTLSQMKDGLGGAHHDIFERITTRFTHLCKNKLNCR